MDVHQDWRVSDPLRVAGSYIAMRNTHFVKHFVYFSTWNTKRISKENEIQVLTLCFS